MWAVDYLQKSDILIISIFCILCFILSFSVHSLKIDNYKIGFVFIVPLVFIVSYIVAFRDVYSTPDTLPYINMIEDLRNGNEVFGYEVGFIFFVNIANIMDSSINFIFITIPTLFLLSYYFFSFKISNSVFFSCLVTIALINYPFFYSLNGNVIRQALALSIFILSLCFNDRKYLCLFGLLVSSVIHNSIFILIVFYVLQFGFKKKYIIIFWLLATLLSYFNVLSSIISPLSQYLEGFKAAMYLKGEHDYNIGFRFDFWIMSSLPILFLLTIKNLRVENKNLLILTKLTALVGNFHILSLIIPYSDRFGVMAWIFYPLIFIAIFKEFLINFKRKNNGYCGVARI
ncbi:EpsG family protein [Vibrio sp. B172a]|uniref:EpsG family protein n=1 Tax=Vibrio sp. B172a TaxID=2835790 RepID=UPI0025557777|nr:EpsG family protein [Vibrio sp. B172a]